MGHLAGTAMLGLLAACVWTGAGALAQTPVGQPAVTASGLAVRTEGGVLTLEPWSERIIHVRFAKSAAAPAPYNSWVIGAPVRTSWTHEETPESWVLKTGELEVRIRKSDAAVSFRDRTGALLSETGGRQAAAASGPVRQGFDVKGPIYGLGQHQSGLLDYRGTTVRLQQANREVAVPMVVSPRGFGLLWNNASVSEADVGVAAEAALVIRSEAGGAIDYDFIYGPELDDVVAGYRQLTGDAPLMPRWMFGLWQSRERYKTQAELLSVGARYRAAGVPIDVVVQDWQYWQGGQWGGHQFDPVRYADPKAMVQAMHADHLHAAVSVWPRFDLDTANLAELDRAGAVYPRVYPNVYPAGKGRWYDPFSPAGKDLYWSQVRRNLGVLGFDAWWLDASEAELGGNWGEMRDVVTAAGPGAEVFNAYPLEHTTGVYRGARRDMGGRRPVLLTRSAFAGQQRNGAVTWSGDTTGDWDTFRKQIPAALNFSLSGIPYWSADIGGFFAGDPQDAAYAELFIRWYQFAVFNPMFRVHGTGAGKEIWAFRPEDQRTLLGYDQLRYRLLPYIYSLSWDVTHGRSTMMRALAMDFRTDERVLGIADQFMFGRAFLVSPVTQQGAEVRTVYLPAGGDWYDFWTGKRLAGGKVVAVEAPIGRIPLHVRAGAVVPLGPVKPYADAPSEEPLEIRVYPGRDGTFELYDDEGDGFGYEEGRFATTTLRWRDQPRSLEIGARQGRFPGMPARQRLRIVCAARPDGPPIDVVYSGQAMAVPLPTCAS